MRTNPKATQVIVDNVEYFYVCQDFERFIRINVFQNEKLIGRRDMPHTIRIDDLIIQYLIKRIRLGEYGINEKSKKSDFRDRSRMWLSNLRKLWDRTT